MELGTLEIGKLDLKKLSTLLSARFSGVETLFDNDDPSIAKLADDLFKSFEFDEKLKQETLKRRSKTDYQKVDINGITTSFNRTLGAELIGLEFFKRIGFEEILDSLNISSKQKTLIKAQIISRLVNPGSELSTIRWLNNTSSLPELLDIDTVINKNDFYEISDLLILKKEEIEAKANANQTKLYGQKKLLLFDLTNTYIEGTSKLNELGQYGRSKEKRSDCLLVSLAIVVDEKGIPTYSEILKGNQSEPITLKDVLDRLDTKEQLFGRIKPTIVMDRGIATKANLELIKSRGFNHIVIERLNDAKNYIDDFKSARETFETIGNNADDQVFVKFIPNENGSKVLCLSESKAQKESGIDQKRLERFLLGFNKIADRVKNKTLRDVNKVNIALGRLISQYPSIARHYEIITDTESDKPKVTSISLKEKDSLNNKSSLYGCYVISTNHKDLTAKEIWDLYMTLAKVENAFRSLKSELGLRPIHHQKTNRVIAHLFISVLAYHLLSAIEFELAKSGDKRRWKTIREVLLSHQRSTIIFTDNKEQIHHIRTSSLPEPEQKVIYEALNIKDKLKRKHRVIGTL